MSRNSNAARIVLSGLTRGMPGIGILALAFLFFASAPAFGQNSELYRQAAQSYRNAAAQCQNPAGAACLRQSATYYDCLANQLQGGGSCGNPPTCSSSCVNAAGNGVIGNSLLAATTLSTNPKAQALGLGLALGLKFLMDHDSNQPTPEPQPPVNSAELEAAAAAAQQQRINADAATLLQESNDLLGSLDSSSGTAAEPNAASALDLLLDTGKPSNASTSAVSALLDGTVPDGPAEQDSNSTISALLDQPPTIPSSSSPTSGAQFTIPSSEEIDTQEVATAASIGPDWGVALSDLKDASSSAFENVTGKVVDSTLKVLGDSVSPNYVEAGTKGVLSDILASSPAHGQETTTLGDVVADKATDYAAEKTANFLINKKDELACSGETTEVDEAGCMVYQTPSNIGTVGLKKYGDLLIQRFSNLWDKAYSEMFGQSQ